jgi:DNA-directed RNA polymerase specialized sigma24 family protein
MSDDSASSLIPPQPIPEGAQTLTDRVRGLMDGQPKDDATVAQALEGMEAVVDRIAAGLYSLASMLVGEGEDSIELVETTIATVPASAMRDPIEGRKNCRLALCGAAIELLAQRDPDALPAPENLHSRGGCIDDEDLDAAAESRLEFERLIVGPERGRVRRWLVDLRPGLRTVFVLRVSAGFTAQETADLLAAHGGPQAAGWTEEAVREVFREALCSLASQVLQASVQSATS